MKRRNTPAFTAMAFVFFAVSVALSLGGIIWYLEEPFSVKGYYGMGIFCTIMASFTLQKVIRDNEEDKNSQASRPRNTMAFTAMAFVFFAVSAALTLGGIIWYLEQPFSVKGYYGMGVFCTIMASFTLQKVIRDNEEDKRQSGRMEAIVD
ncbi:YiaA/YiaB family inner membrane protein [Paenibacillus sambharensis]